MLRHLPPANSPLSLAALLAGLRATFTGAESARTRVAAAIKETCHPRALLLTDTGTTALTLGLRAITEAADEPSPIVALPGYCCYDIATAAEGAGVRVALYDLDPDSLGPDLPSLERALSAGARAVVAVHLYGIPVDYSAVRSAAEARGAVIIEDAAQGIGTIVEGRPAGTSGSLGVLSFGRGKGITAGGGGALLANDEAGTRLLRTIERQLIPSGTGWWSLAASTAQWMFARPSVYGLVRAMPFLKLGETIYRDVAPTGVMPRANAGILGRTWVDAPLETATRRRHGDHLQQALAASGAFETIAAPISGSVCGYLRLPVKMTAGAESSIDPTSAAAGRLGVMPGYPRTLDELAGVNRRLVNDDESLSGSRSLSRRLLTLPTHGLLGEGDIDALRVWIEEAGRRTNPRPGGQSVAHTGRA